MKKIFLRLCISSLALLLVFLSLSLFEGIADLNELVSEGKDLANKEEQNTELPDDPLDPSEGEDPFDAEDNSNAASQSVFHAESGAKLGVVADDLGLIGPSLYETAPDGLIVFQNGTMQLNNTASGWFYEVGQIFGDDLVFSHRLYYRLLKDGEWESNVHVVDGTNFVLYLSSTYDSSNYSPYQRYDESFSASNPYVRFSAAIGLAEGFTPDFEAFRLYALME